MINPSVIVYLILALVIIWKASIAMIEKKRIFLFLPFFIIGILFCFQSASLFHEIPPQLILGPIKFIFLFILIWIAIIIKSVGSKND